MAICFKWILKDDENPARSLVLPNKFVLGKKVEKCNKNTDTYGLIYMTGG